MITIKGTQTGNENTDPAAPYARKPEGKSGGVTKISMLLISAVLYLKTFLSGRSEVAEQALAQDAPNEAENLPESRDIPDAGQQRAAGGGDMNRMEQEELDPVVLNLTPGSDTIAFASREQQVASPVFQPGGFINMQANDNGSPGAGNSSFQPRPVSTGGGAQGDTPPSGGQAVDPGPQERNDDTKPDEDADSDDDDPTEKRAPRLTGPVYLNDLSGCAVLAIGLAELLRGATDPDGDVLSVEGVTASSGTLDMVEDGLWKFSPGGDPGPVTITYRISDGSFEVDQTLHFAVVPGQVIGGTEQNDILIGSMGCDIIKAGAGDDLVDARAGNDTIQGGDGDDHIRAGAGDDLVHGGAGDDVVFGGAGDDEIHGNDGDDRLFGEAGNDLIFGGAGADTIRGEAGDDDISGGDGADHLLGGGGDDLLFGNDGNDTVEGNEGDDLVIAGFGNDLVLGGTGHDRLTGGEGHDYLDGGAGNDILIGEAGNDVIEGGAGMDLVMAGEGDDRVIAAADGADDGYHGGMGYDLLDYSATEDDLEVDLVGGRVTGIEVGNDTISGFERVVTGAGDDLILFGGTPVSMSGGDGCNIFEFSAPQDAPPSLNGENRQTRYEIEDFKVGDRLRVSQWEIFEETVDEAEDRFEQFFRDRLEEDEVPIRYRNEWMDEMSETIIEADLDGNSFYETAIVLGGRHALVFFEYENA